MATPPRYVLERPTTIGDDDEQSRWMLTEFSGTEWVYLHVLDIGTGRPRVRRAIFPKFSSLPQFPACHSTTTTLYPFSRLSILNMPVCPAISYKFDLLLTVIFSVNLAVVPQRLPVQQLLPKLAVLPLQLLLPATLLPTPQHPLPPPPLPMQLPRRAPECLPRWRPPLDPSL